MNRAQEIASQLTEQMLKVEMRNKFKCSHRTVNEVYKIKGWEVERIDMAKVARVSKQLQGAGISKYEEVMQRYGCNKGEAKRALTQSGLRSASSFYADLLDATMYRPGGRNLLCEAWV